MQTTAIRTVANSLPEKGVILLTLLISDRYILFAELGNIFVKWPDVGNNDGNLALIYYLCPEYTDMARNFGRVGGGLARGCGF